MLGARGEVRRRRLAGQQDFALISGDVDTGLFLNLFIFRQGAIDAQFRGTVIDWFPPYAGPLRLWCRLLPFRLPRRQRSPAAVVQKAGWRGAREPSCVLLNRPGVEKECYLSNRTDS